MAAKRRPGPRARAAAAPPLPARSVPRALGRLAPTRRSLLVGVILLALGLAAYAIARQTSVFAVRTIQVTGAPPAVAAEIRRAAADFEGVSLVALDAGELLRRIERVPAVEAARYDRSFPHTLRIVVRPEQEVGVLRRGPDSWLVSARGRVLQRLQPRTRLELPRIWVPAATQVELGQILLTSAGGTAARALAPLVHARFPVRISTVTLSHDELAFQLAGGVEVRLGRPEDLRLKLAIARRIVTALPAGARYVDVSVAERPVVGTDPRVSG